MTTEPTLWVVIYNVIENDDPSTSTAMQYYTMATIKDQAEFRARQYVPSRFTIAGVREIAPAKPIVDLSGLKQKFKVSYS